MSASLDQLSLEECSQFIAISDKDSLKWTVFATISISCRRSGIGEYETTVRAEMGLVGLTEKEVARLSIEENVLKKYWALEPTVTMATTKRISRALTALLEGGDGAEEHEMVALVRQLRRGPEKQEILAITRQLRESEDDEIFVDRRVNVTFTVARLTTGLNDLLAGGPGEAFDDVAKAASERVRALRQIHESVESR